MKTVVINPYCTNDESKRISRRLIEHLKRHDLNVILDSSNGLFSNIKTLQKNQAALSVAINASKEGSSVGVYCNAKGLDIAESVKASIEELKPAHEIKQPGLYILQYAPCPSIMINYHEAKQEPEAIAVAVAKGVLSHFEIEWQEIQRKKKKGE